MILFIIAMHSLTNLVVFENKQPNYVIVDNDMKKCRRMIEKEGIDEGTIERSYSYSWGEIKISVSPYKDDILLINMTSEAGNGLSIRYYFLHVNKQDDKDQ